VGRTTNFLCHSNIFPDYPNPSKTLPRPANEEAETKAQKSAALVVNSVGVMSTPKRTARPRELAEATDVIGNAIKTAREAKLARARDNKENPKAAKSLAELLTETAAEDQNE
jgi:hypothetical protein